MQSIIMFLDEMKQNLNVPRVGLDCFGNADLETGNF